MYGKSIFGGRVGNGDAVPRVNIDPTYVGAPGLGLFQPVIPQQHAPMQLHPGFAARAPMYRPIDMPGVPSRVILPAIVAWLRSGACPSGSKRVGAACVQPLVACPSGTVRHGVACVTPRKPIAGFAGSPSRRPPPGWAPYSPPAQWQSYGQGKGHAAPLSTKPIAGFGYHAPIFLSPMRPAYAGLRGLGELRGFG